MHTITVTRASNIFLKVKGLLGTDKPYALLLKTHWGIHTFGMKYAIDVIILDGANKIVALKQNLKPNRIFLWNPKYEKVVELPSGFIRKNKLILQQKIQLVTL